MSIGIPYNPVGVAGLMENTHENTHSVQPCSDLLAESLRADPRVEQALKLLLAALQDTQRHISKPKPADPQLSASFNALIERLGKARGGAPFFPYLSSGLGHGALVELADGSIKLDFICGIGVHGLGHSHPDLVATCVRAALEDTIMQGNLQQHPPSVSICERMMKLANQFGAQFDHCLLSTSGAMANENALKIAFHNRFPANRIVALDNCFAGRSMATAQLTDRPQYRSGLPTTLAVDYLPCEDRTYSTASQNRAVEELDKLLRRYPGQHAALWLELVSGEGGYYPGTAEYFRKLIARAQQDKLLIVFDEIQTFSRLSQPFAFQHFGLDSAADIVSFGKITQLCGTLYRGSLKPKGPLLSQTFTASTSSIAAAHVILDHLQKSGCFGPSGKNMQRHQMFAAGLQSLSDKYPGKLAGPFGLGMMVAFTPGDGSNEQATRMVHMMYAAGLMGFVAGHDPTRIRFLPPPGVTTDDDIRLACEILDDVLSRF